MAGLVGSGGGGLTALTFAAREGDIDSARKLLDAGADVNQTTEYGWTPLLTAVNNRNYRLAKLLLERGANANLANKGGWTPLYLAVDNRNIEGGDYPVPKPDLDHLELIEALLVKGANPNAAGEGQHADAHDLHDAVVLRRRRDAVHPRRRSRATPTLMTLLLKHGADPKAVTANGDSALTAAAGIGWVDGVTYERSPAENLEAVQMLLDLGLDPNHANNEGRTRADGRGAEGPARRDPAARRARREARDARPRQPRHAHPGRAPSPGSRSRRSTTPRGWCASASSRRSSGPRRRR